MKSKLVRAPQLWRRVLRKCRSTRIDRVQSWTPLIDPFPLHFLIADAFFASHRAIYSSNLHIGPLLSHSISKRTYHAYRQLNSQASLYLYQKPHIRHRSHPMASTHESLSTPDLPNGAHILNSDLTASAWPALRTFRDLRGVVFELEGSASSFGTEDGEGGDHGGQISCTYPTSLGLFSRVVVNPREVAQLCEGSSSGLLFAEWPRVATFRVSIEPAARFFSFVFG